MSGTGPGVVAGEAIAAASAELADQEGEQLPLFEVPSRAKGEGDERLNALIGDAAARAVEIRRGPGRPKGSANRSTVELRNYLLARGVHPLETLMRWALHTPESLAAELACTKLEAFDRLKTVWAELAPYFTAKLQPTDQDGKPVPFLQFIIGGQEGGAAADRPPWQYMDADPIKTAEISHSEPTEPAQSHEAQSHEVDK